MDSSEPLRRCQLGKPRSALRFGGPELKIHALVPPPVRSREQPPMMQAFRNSAKVAGAIFALLIGIVAATPAKTSVRSAMSR